MNFKVTLSIVLVTLFQIQCKELDPGPQAINEAKSSSASQSTQKRYATKEVILYLTPTQIRALQAGKGLDSQQSVSEPEDKVQERESDFLLIEHEAFLHEQFENLKSARVAPVREPQVENLNVQSSFYKQEELNENQFRNVNLENTWGQEQAKWEEDLKPQLYSNEWNTEQFQQSSAQKESEPELQKDAWLSYGPVSEKKEEESLLQEQFKQQWNRILEQNRVQLKALKSLEPGNQKSNIAQLQVEKPLLQLQYGPKYNDQKSAIEIEKKIRENHQQELTKQSALVQAEAIAKSPPILVHQEVTITKHRPVPVVKHVKVPIPTPVLVPVPEPYEVKVPHPYPVPLEIIKHVPVPIVQTKNIEVEKPVPYEVEKRIPVPVTKQVFVNVDRPYIVHKVVPVEIRKEVPVEVPIHKAEKVTILRHIWKH